MVSIIVAMSRNRVIGQNGKLPWHLPSDLARFKKLTWGHTVIMGRKTWDSLDERFRPLPGRDNIVLSRDRKTVFAGATKFTELQHAIDHTKQDSEIFVIGGESVFKEALPIAKRIYLTQVEIECEGDTFFPEFESAGWSLIERLQVVREKNEYPMFFSVYKRS
jgi:dihydrofolate reductase